MTKNNQNPTAPARSRRRTIGLTIAGAILALVLPTLGMITYHWAALRIATAQESAGRRSFTITSQTKYACYKVGDTMAANNYGLSFTDVYAVRGDGASAEKRMVPEQNRATRELYLPGGVIVYASDEVKKKTTVQKSQSTFPSRPDPNKLCLKTYAGGDYLAPSLHPVIDGFETIKGVNTVRVKYPNPPVAVGMDYTYWHALDYGCIIVQADVISRYIRKDGSAGESRNITELLSIREGEPDAQLFDVSSYEEVKPTDRVIAGMNWNAQFSGYPVKPERVKKILSDPAYKRRDALWESLHKK